MAWALTTKKVTLYIKLHGMLFHHVYTKLLLTPIFTFDPHHLLTIKPWQVSLRTSHPKVLLTQSPSNIFLMEKLFLLAIILAFSTVPHIMSIPFDERDLESDEKVWGLYERWQRHHSVYRNHHEKHQRFGVFKENAKYIHEFNKKAKHYKLALNKFGDLTKVEFQGSYASSRVQEHKMFQSHPNTGKFMYGIVSVHDLPMSIDWRSKGAVTGVKDQGKCGE
jgi:Cathepsin propeptide inhibitor domain (I29)